MDEDDNGKHRIERVKALKYVCVKSFSLILSMNLSLVLLNSFLTLSIYHSNLHRAQAINCCHNSQFVVDKEDLKVGENF